MAVWFYTLSGGDKITTSASQNPRYEADEAAPLRTTLGYGFQFSLLASASLLVTPVIVAKASGRGDDYLMWMIFASLIAVGLSTLLQVRKLGGLGAGAVLPMFTAAFAIPFCIAAVDVDGPGSPATLTTLVLVCGAVQLVISKWLFLLRRLITPTLGGTVMMILSITLASVVFGLLNDSYEDDPTPPLLIALATLATVVGLTFRGTALLRLWAPMIGIVIGCAVAVGFGMYETDLIAKAAWVGIPNEWPGVGLDFGVGFWTLLLPFLFLGIIISIQANGESIAHQRAASRDDRAIDFRQVQGSLSGTGASNVIAGALGAVPNIIHPGVVAFTRVTGVASRRVGYCIGLMFILVAFSPKASAVLGSIPGPVMTGYLLMVTGTLFVDGARLVIQTESNSQKVVAAGVAFWIGAAFQFGLRLPSFGPGWDTVLKSGISTGGVAAIVMILFLEITQRRSMRFRSPLDIESLPDLNDFMARFAERRGWNDAMKNRLSAVAEETLLTLAPLDLGDWDGDDDNDGAREEKQLLVLASSDGPVAHLEFIGGGDADNLEDRIRQLQQHDTESPPESDLSLVLLRSYASSVLHQQYQGTDVITVSVEQPE